MVYLHTHSLPVARHYAAMLGLRDWHYVSSPDMMRGAAIDSTLMVLPGAEQHPNSRGFSDLARDYQMNIIHIFEDGYRRHGNG
jgi:hypothetical protein